MNQAFLMRMQESDEGTFGKMYFGDSVVYSGELPDRGNEPNFSRIPEGTYDVLWTFSPAFKRMMYLVSDVRGRSGIRIHAANYMGDSRRGLRCHLNGCIALGKRFGSMDGQAAILNSRTAVQELEKWGGGKSFQLEIA